MKERFIIREKGGGIFLLEVCRVFLGLLEVISLGIIYIGGK